MPFRIQWTDDDKELNYIQNEITLVEAIDFYYSGDEGSVASSGSVFSSRSSSRHSRITMHVEICVDYDGPSLSDTASLASRDEDSPEGSQISFSPGELSSSSQDDDAVTVSSKDTRAQRGSRQGRADSSLIKKIWNNTARTGSSSTIPNKPALKCSRSGLFKFGSRASNAEEETTAGSSRDDRANGRSLSSLIDTERAYPGDPSAVFQRLKLEEERSPDSSHDRSLMQTDLGKAWLKNQSSFQMGGVLRGPPSLSDDQFSLNTDTPLSDGNPDTDILLQKDERGKDYYIYTGSGSSESAGDLDYEVVNGTQPGKPRHVLEAVLSLILALTVNDMCIPHELLVPEEVTECSECGCILDQIKYTCTTCGEKTPISRTELAAAAAVRKGKTRVSDYQYHSEYELQESTYPPRAHRSPGASNTHPKCFNVNVCSSNSKPLPALPSSSPTRTIFGRNLGSQSTLVASSSSGSSSPTTRVGYELCFTCFGKVGLDHALPGGMDSPSSPTMPPTAQEMAIARRSAPKRRGELRHAFLFQMWGFNGWQHVGAYPALY